MGGPGSGNRWRYGAKSTTADCRSIDARRWARAGVLTPGYWGSWQWTRDGEVVAIIQMRTERDRVVLSYRYRQNGGDWGDIEEPVALERTPCRYGGDRVWFLCPAVGCGRRVALLFLGGRYFACRHCYRLAYPSQNENAGDRAIRRAENIRMRLGGSPGVLTESPDKPKWMRWPTYWRLREQADAHIEDSMRDLMLRLGIDRHGGNAIT